MIPTQTRRRFLKAMSLAGAASFVSPMKAMAAEGALETTAVRMTRGRGICSTAEAFAAEELLRAEGFKEISYVEVAKNEVPPAITAGNVDFSLNFVVNHIQAIDHGAPITILAGVHGGCYELFARESLGSITELKGKRVGLEAGSPALLRLMAAQVGLDPEKDFQWVIDPETKPLDLFSEGKIDGFLAFPPEPQELRARRAGRVILDTTVDRPWSQYFCCMVAANREYVVRYPVASKRVLRSFLRAADLCVSDPPSVARKLVDGGITRRYDYALQTVNEIHYDKWRDYDAEDTVRFYALRLHESGLIKSLPNKLITHNTDFRSLDELKRELKA
jgi:NitT/TauT family transport system substrate-binding protein